MSLSRVLLVAVLFALPAYPDAYRIDFFLTEGTVAPTAGYFSYDSGAPAFSNFHVLFDGLDFDLTQAANYPEYPPAAGPADGFALMSQTLSGGGDYTWNATSYHGHPSIPAFYFARTGGSYYSHIWSSNWTSTTGSIPPPEEWSQSSGTWSIAPIAVPEPQNESVAYAVVLLIALFALGARSRRPTKSVRT